MPRARLSTGISLDYFECGDKQGEPILFVHGYSDSWRIWESSIPYLPHQYRLIFVTLRGFGDSDKPKAGFRQTDFVSDLEAFLRAMDLSQVVLVGHSMGGFIGHHFAVEHPDRVKRLVLVGTAATGSGNDPIATENAAISKLGEPIDAEYVRNFQIEPMMSEVHESIVETIINECFKAPVRVWQEAMLGMLEEDHSARLAEISVPTLILCGGKDLFFTEAHQREMANAIPGSRVKIYPGVGHGVQWEKPEEFARDITDFLGG